MSDRGCERGWDVAAETPCGAKGSEPKKPNGNTGTVVLACSRWPITTADIQIESPMQLPQIPIYFLLLPLCGFGLAGLVLTPLVLSEVLTLSGSFGFTFPTTILGTHVFAERCSLL